MAWTKLTKQEDVGRGDSGAWGDGWGSFGWGGSIWTTLTKPTDSWTKLTTRVGGFLEDDFLSFGFMEDTQSWTKLTKATQ
jgi:hypothetical protein